ncbi:hypothetical protein CAPTEDRAFT_176484 [Capitella teleta]|uniref:Beta-1,4-mannosyl-glycoprotein 4-beta-N-acetylglucosaminyltransferase n=1 Tax=Capitella teleta TaxID=283909 RepID=R7ULJ8_CAPTE|nr:hypothetical protein CAPTEDRAFT_176484 [Capitella teleta]|eukprot:ELU06968.1 hypothetical protein CAPTEDRAFT_176484 [Capitella teleta]
MIHFKKVSPSTPPVIIGKVSSASVASQKIHKNLCQNFNKSKSFHQKLYCLEDNVNVSSLFQPSKYGWCYLAGSRSAVNPFEECKCRKGWHGQYCSTPDVVERSDYPNEYGTSIRAEPRRIIYAFPFTFEFEMLEARMAELGDVVDVFVILESNYTASGKTKPRYLLQNLQQEYLSQYQHKILLLQMDSFPREGKRNGWVVDEKIRQYLGREIFERIPNLRPDDMIVIQDADELPVKETIFFLKFHNGFPEPIGMHLRHNVFGFFWQGDDLSSHVFGACTVAMMDNVFKRNPYNLRSASKHMQQNSAVVDDYKYRKSGRIREWSFGSREKPCGWHCSWCFEPDRIRLKMISAHSGDVPRWGSDRRKTDLKYIEQLVRNGTWFDDRSPLIKANATSMFAPKFFRRHQEKYRLLLLKPQ